MPNGDCIPLIVKRLSDATEGVFHGLASVPLPDRQGDVLPLAAFAQSVTEFKAGRLVLPILLDHDPARQIGSVLALDLTDAGLEVTAQLALGLDGGREALERMKAGPVGLSIGFRPVPGSITQQGALRVIGNVDLHEISVVSIPANGSARTLTIKSVREIEHVLRDAGLSNRQAKRAASAAYKALALPDNESDESQPADDEGAAVALVEVRRLNAILRGEV